MAKQTDLSLRNQLIYQVFPRQHSKSQDFKGVRDDLPRMKKMGVDILYLLPFHPIGVKDRKGEKGSPYAIYDFYQVHPDLGSLEDLKDLVQTAHDLGIKVMMDIVINHTSRDSVLTQEHPEWFYHKADGTFANRVGDWSDITDLNYELEDVRNYFYDLLVYWAKIVDGFRCDVAPLLPIDFWVEARSRISKIKDDHIWLTESVHPGFIKYIRDLGYDCSSDSQMYDAFDICYDYDIYDDMDHYLLKDQKHLKIWLNQIYRQEMIYPKNYIKLRSFENHDQPRLREKARDHDHFIQLLTMMFFIKGTPFVYAGMEHEANHKPDLFEDDLVAWDEKQSLEDYISRLAHFKKEAFFKDGNFHLEHDEDVAVFSYDYADDYVLGIFNLENKDQIEVNLKDGFYEDVLDQRQIEVKHGKIQLDEKPLIIKTKVEHKK